jgi:hypothetical protein
MLNIEFWRNLIELNSNLKWVHSCYIVIYNNPYAYISVIKFRVGAH